MISIGISILGKDHQIHTTLEVHVSLSIGYQCVNWTHISDNGSSLFMDHFSFRIVLDYEPLQIMVRFNPGNGFWGHF